MRSLALNVNIGVDFLRTNHYSVITKQIYAVDIKFMKQKVLKKGGSTHYLEEFKVLLLNYSKVPLMKRNFVPFIALHDVCLCCCFFQL